MIGSASHAHKKTQPSASVRHPEIGALRGIGFGRRAFGVCLLPRSALQGACLRGDCQGVRDGMVHPFPLTDRALIRVLRRDLAPVIWHQPFHALPGVIDHPFDAAGRERRSRGRRTRPAQYDEVGLLHLDGADLTPRPFSERRQKLVGLDKPLPCLFVIDQFNDGDDLMQWCEKFKLEGVVSKKRDAPYVSGECRSWVKSKCATWKEENKERWRSFEEAQLRDTTTGRGRR